MSCIDYSNEEEALKRVEKSDDSNPGSDIDDSPMKRNWQKNCSDSEEEIVQDTNRKKPARYSSDEEKLVTKETCRMESESEIDSGSDVDSDSKIQKEKKNNSDYEHLRRAGDAESGDDSEEEEERVGMKEFRTHSYRGIVDENKMGSERQNLSSNHSEESVGEMEGTERSYKEGHLTVSEEEKVKKSSSRPIQQLSDTLSSEGITPLLLGEDDPSVEKWEENREDSRRYEVKTGSSGQEGDRSQSNVHDSGNEVDLDGRKGETSSDSNDESVVQKNVPRHVTESSSKYESSSDGESSLKQKHSYNMSQGLEDQADKGSHITYSRKKESGPHTLHELHRDGKYTSRSSEEKSFSRRAKDSELSVSSEDTSDDEPLSKKRKKNEESDSDSDDVPLSKKLSLSGNFQSASETEETKKLRSEDRKGRETWKESDNSSSDSGSDDTELQHGQKKQQIGISAEKRNEKSSQDPGKHPKIVRMKRYLREAGIRVQNYNTLWEGCKSIPSRVKRMLQLLEKKGLKGKPTLASCKKLRKKLEKKQEISELDLNLIIESGAGGDSNRDEEDDWETKKEEKSKDLFPPGTNVWAKWRQGSFERVARPAVVIHMKDVPSEHQAALKRKAEQPGNLIVSWLGDWSGWYKVVSVGTVRHLTDSARDRRWAGRSASVHNAFLHALSI